MKGRRQFVVDGNVIIGRPVKDQEFPIPWFERRIHTPHTEVFSEFEKKKQKQLYSRPEYSIEANISLLDLTKKNKAFEIADQKARMSALHDSASKTKTEDSRIQNKKNFEVLRRKQPSYSISAASRMAPHNVLDGPSPGPKYRPLSPSGYRHFSTSVTGATFGTASREIANLIRKEHWENRWRPLRISCRGVKRCEGAGCVETSYVAPAKEIKCARPFWLQQCSWWVFQPIHSPVDKAIVKNFKKRSTHSRIQKKYLEKFTLPRKYASSTYCHAKTEGVKSKAE